MKEYEARTMDELGRIVLPRVVREKISAEAGDTFDVALEEGKIVLTPQFARCKLCGTLENPVEVNGRTICRGCIEQIKNH